MELFTDFASSDDEARSRAQTCHVDDPFDDVKPALLNNVDILRYVRQTGMLFPLDIDVEPRSKEVKPASIGIRMIGRVVYWDEDNRRHEFELLRAQDLEGPDRRVPTRDRFALAPNSIAYVTLQPYFRLPSYIAVRFNLTIRDVYRGLLLGTGPIVDPGYHGYLSFPLHNLTANTYHFEAGEVMVWVEFSKISPIVADESDIPVAPFPEDKKYRQHVGDYLQYATAGASIRSSVPEAVKDARMHAESAAARAKRLERIGWIAGVTIVLAVCSLVISAISLSWSIRSDIRAVERQLDQRVRPLEEARLKTLDDGSRRVGANSRLTGKEER